MTDPELTERVRELRQRGRTPKEIAKALGLPPATVAPLIRAVAATQPRREARLIGCWVNRGWASEKGSPSHRLLGEPGLGGRAQRHRPYRLAWCPCYGRIRGFRPGKYSGREGRRQYRLR